MTVLAIAMAFAVFASGCGGDDSTSASAAGESDGSSSLSKAEFIKRAAAACASERENSFEQIATYSEKHRSDGLPEAVLAKRAVRATLLSIIAAELDDLQKLEAPAGDEQEVEAMLAAQQAALNEAKANKRKLEDVEDYFTDADKELQAYGLDECTKGTGD
jgi:hypothetical protein